MKKRFIALLTIFVLIFSFAYSEELAATPTDLEEAVIEEILPEEVLIEDEIMPEEPSIEEEILTEDELPIEEEIEEEIDIEELYGDRRIEIKFLKTPKFIGDNVIMTFELINYPPGRIEAIQWQWSEDNINWFTIEGATGEIYEFIVDRSNYTNWWRVEIHYKIII